MLEMRMTVVVVPAIYSYAIFGDKNYSSAQIIHIIPFAIQVSKYIRGEYFSLGCDNYHGKVLKFGKFADKFL